jgi:heme/copper-type cytochrome/quinol oxidase subunit 3
MAHGDGSVVSDITLDEFEPGPGAAGPAVPARSYSTAWWGMIMLISTEAMVFAILLATYSYLEATDRVWPPTGVLRPELRLSFPFSFILWGSSIPIFWADAAIRKGRVRSLQIGLVLSGLMGLAFLLYTLKEFHDLRFGWRDSSYGSVFYTIVGLHATHVFVGLLMNAVVSIKAFQGKFSARRHESIDVFSLYWHFVDGVWVFVFGFLFLGIRLR